MEEKKKQNREVYVATEDFKQYDRGVRYLQSRGLYDKVDKSLKFFEGRQWGDNPEGFPVVNIIEPIIKYKVGTLCQNGLTLHFEAGATSKPNMISQYKQIAKQMSDLFRRTWEQLDGEAKLWDIVEDAYQTGTTASYCYWNEKEKKIEMEIKSSTEILFSDEQEMDIEKQEFILLPYRDTVSNVRKQAKANGLPEDLISQITSDTDLTKEVGEMAKAEVESDLGKTLCVVKLWKENGIVWTKRFTNKVVFNPPDCTNMKRYPVSILHCNVQKGWCRGGGEVYDKIPNQIEINKAYARAAVISKQFSYPKAVYNANIIEDISLLDEFGSAIAVNGNPSDLKQAIDFLTPPQPNTDAAKLANDLYVMTKDNAGASDSALGNVNLATTSGAAILAARDSSAVTLNRQSARVKSFVENLGKDWWEIYAVYSPNGIDVIETQDLEIDGKLVQVKIVTKLKPEQINDANLSIKVDTSPTSAYSIYATEQSLANYMTAGYLTFDEYVDALPDGSPAPKEKLLSIIEGKREKDILKQQITQAEELIAQLMQGIDYSQSNAQAVNEKYNGIAQLMPQLEAMGRQIMQDNGMIQKQTQNGANPQYVANGNA